MDIANPVGLDDAESWLSAVVTTLLGSPWTEDFKHHVAAWTREWFPDRTWGVRDHDRWVATLATEHRTLTVPGPPGQSVDIDADAVSAVSVAATHRRRGLLTGMIAESMQQAVDRGDAVSILIAAEWPIYGRFGYAPATRSTGYTLRTRWAGANIAGDPAGALRQVTPEELGPVADGIFDAARRRWAGQVARPLDWWKRRLGLDGYHRFEERQGNWILHESDGVADGLLCWRVKTDFELYGDYGVVEALELVAGSDTAYRNLFAYLAALDVVGEVKLFHRPLDEPVRWLLPDGRALHQEVGGDDVWVRLLDVPAALSARGYASTGRLVIDVVDDDLGGFAAGRYAIDADEHGASCTRTGDSPDLRLPQRVLAGVYLGDHSVRAMSIAGGVDELTPGAVAHADAMFATALRPWNCTGF